VWGVRFFLPARVHFRAPKMPPEKGLGKGKQCYTIAQDADVFSLLLTKSVAKPRHSPACYKIWVPH
jgi:hypothetical protein